MNIDPLPRATVGEIIGLLEILSDYKNCQEDLFELAASLNMDIDDFSPIVDAAELLGFVEIVNGDLRLTQTGKDFVEADINSRKKIFKKQLKRLRIFKDILKMLRHADENTLDREVFVDYISESIPPEDAERVLAVAIDWGRFAELIGYSADSEEVYIDHE